MKWPWQPAAGSALSRPHLPCMWTEIGGHLVPEYLETPHWFLLLLLPETQTVFDVTEKLMFSARGLCLSSPKAGRSNGEGPPGSRKVEGEVTEKKKKKSMSAKTLGRKELFWKEKQDSVSGVQSEVCGLGKGWTEWAETIRGFP